MVKSFAKMMGWKGKNSSTISSAIDFLEKSRTVNYDAVRNDAVAGMGAVNHHMKSLAHSPDLIGLFFSVVDQFLAQASFVSDGQMIVVHCHFRHENVCVWRHYTRRCDYAAQGTGYA